MRVSLLCETAIDVVFNLGEHCTRVDGDGRTVVVWDAGKGNHVVYLNLTQSFTRKK